MTAPGRTRSCLPRQRSERVVVAVLAFVLWLAPILALGNTAPRAAVPGSDICRAGAKNDKAQEQHPAGHRCQECCCSAVRLASGPPPTAEWFFIPAAAPVLAGAERALPRALAWRDLAPPPRAPPAADGIPATAPGIG